MEVGRSRHEGTARSALKESAESTYLPAAFSRMPYRVCSDGTEVPLHELKRFVVDARSLAAMLGSHEDVFEPQAALAEKLWKNNANPTGWLSSRPERASAPGRDRTAHPSGSPSWPTPGASNAYWARPRIKSSSVPTSSMVAGRIVNTVWKRNLQQIVVLNLSTRRDSTSGAVERIPHVRVPLPRAYAYAGERNCRSRFL